MKFFPIFLFFIGVTAVPTHHVRRSLPDTSWYQPTDHPAHNLFKRASGDGINYAQVGSPTWFAGFPQGTPDPNALPVEWVNALNAAIAAGSIPNVSVSTNTPGTNPVYPNGGNPGSPPICSSTYKCQIPGDIWNAPPGVFASSFDDGPTPSSSALVQFLESNNKTTTHFMIGMNIIYYPSQFQAAFNAGHDIAVHTYTHPYMTTLSNLDVLGQLGWTMELIHNSTGGRVPKYWRPPYGDSDMRVRAIAKEVFGLTTVVWNQDTSDWNGTPQSIETAMTTFLTGSKQNGAVILEHELTDTTVNGFITAYPMIELNGWTFSSLVVAVGDGRSYLNAANSTSNDVKVSDIIFSNSSTISSSSTSSQSTTSTAAQKSVPTSVTKTSGALRGVLSSGTWFSSLLASCLAVFFAVLS